MKIYIDEAGRGPLAGPLCVGLVVNKDKKTDFRKACPLLRDSKKLTSAQRMQAYHQIQKSIQEGKIIALTSSVSPQIIDQYGMTRALSLAICKGLRRLLDLFLATKKKRTWTYKELQECIHQREQENEEAITLIIDGKTDFRLTKDLEIQVETIVKGDDKLVEISMASILAKVERDMVLDTLHEQFPQYGFAQHKGYGTKMHYQALEDYGITNQHRKLFLKKMIPEWKIIPFDMQSKNSFTD